MWLMLILLLGITGVVRALNRFFAFRICPICAGVSATWFLLSAGVLAGYAQKEVFLPLILLLMGGSVVGVAYQGERSFSWAMKFPLLWKMIVIAAGMPLALWAAQTMSIKALAGEIMVLSLLAYLFFSRRPEEKKSAADDISKARERDLEEKLKKCC